MLAIDIKLWRELWNMRMQAIAIALVIVSGVAIFIMSLSTYDSLYETREDYYREHHFAEIFSSLKRAPLSVAKRIEAIPGVDKVETRVVTYVNLDIEGYDDPVSGHLISLPDNSLGLLNQLFLRDGRIPESGRDNEIIISQEFANAHHLKPGDKIRAIINGRSKTLTIVGSGYSPEYISQIAPGAMFPDYKSYGVMWMARKPLASAYDMAGAFNDVSLTLSKGINEQDVIDRVDDILKPYGGTGAYERKDQLSNRFISEELKGLQNMATMFPIIFFGVAAFLLNVVISRLISLEREQISVLKAFGYSNFDVGLHYSKLVLMIVTVGIIAGTGVGIWMGTGLSKLYMEVYSFPFMHYTLNPHVIASGALISIFVALVGTLYAVQKAIKLPPAQGMRPELPTAYRATLVERLGLQKHFSQPSRMILRHIERRPLKSLLTTLGIGMSCGIMMVGSFQESAINEMVEVQYNMSQREDFMALFSEPTAHKSLYSLEHLQGVEHAEGFRSANVRLTFEHRSYRTSIRGIESGSQLVRLLDKDLKEIKIPEEGAIITDYLAKHMHIQPGDLLTVEVLEGNRPTFQVPVIGTAKEYLGMNVYLQRQTLNRLLKEGDVISGAYLQVDEKYRKQIFTKLKEMPRIVGAVEQKSSIEGFYEMMDDTILFFTFISTLLGGSIAFGVVYNSMRIALSERNRELASLRVLGFTRAEVAYILLGEMALLTLAAIPLGFAFGIGLCAYLAKKFESELYRIPLVLETDVYAFAATVVIVSSILSAMMIWRNLAHLDMVAVLKTKE
ncbi:ABC transporter permease [Thiomicrorhabdus sp. zzn3]|uniref:ABC transporter permease n=1 Tax=Thiomicrorhabdus sp. zzn3 TaxID=3039775 RepID=UPI0024370BF6|nr:ABC transporter permease [Thiomicrorhabdus sp. zzn3]MDG6777810.1 ABC transporter permease [Thiomicrorhabdus sp. zzn3]